MVCMCLIIIIVIAIYNSGELILAVLILKDRILKLFHISVVCAYNCTGGDYVLTDWLVV